MPPTFSMGVDKWKCANVPIDCRIYFRGRMKASRITTAKPWRRQSNCYSNKPTLRRINRQARGCDLRHIIQQLSSRRLEEDMLGRGFWCRLAGDPYDIEHDCQPAASLSERLAV